MGVIYELILETDADIPKLVEYALLPESDVVFTKGVLDPVTLGQLFVVFMNLEVLEFMDAPTFAEEGNETEIYEIPTHYIAALATLDETERKNAANAWAMTEEIRIHKELDEAWVQQLLEDIYKLAVRAIREQKKLFLRCSL